MSWNRVVSELNKKLPDFNDDLLIGYKRRNIDRSKDFMSEVFIAAISYINNCKKDIHVEYV